jgi:actin-like ATPase involved in cell morphogenesis
MKLGVDFGTTRIVVASADRGNFPLVSFEAPDGSTPDWFPSLVAVNGAKRRYGWDAWSAQSDEDWTVLRSVKRLLEAAGPQTIIEIGQHRLVLMEVLIGLAISLKQALLSSNLELSPNEPLEVVLGVPAHANSNQRFLTVEAFRLAGFDVLGVLNEPSAASIEFGHRKRNGNSGRETILVYDLGGGTFDASLVVMDENIHHVVATEGIPTLGGDDFDHLLADMALDRAGIDLAGRDFIAAAAWFRLLEECRLKKEALNPNSRRITIELESLNASVSSTEISVDDYYEAARPFVEETLAAAEDLLDRHRQDSFEALYLTGGGSELPLVARVLRERFGRRVRRSAFTRSATAIGLAIQAGMPDAYRLSEQLSRFFGVWREADSGSRITFDPLFPRGMQLPVPGCPPLEVRRRYTPVHNVGHFRFLECTHRAEDGAPDGEITIWDRICFPFDPALASRHNLESEQVLHCPEAPRQSMEELYQCDSSGAIAVTISNLTAGYSRTYRLGRWSQPAKPVKHSPRRRKTSAGADK